MPETYRSGAATIVVDQDELVRQLDQVSDGALSSFLGRVDALLDPIQTAAAARWPERTGRSRRGFSRLRMVSENQAEVALRNVARAARFGFYAFKIRWSVRTEASLDAEAANAGERGTTPATRASLRDNWRRRLTKRHGRGAPSEELAGKQPWRKLVRTPANRAAKRLAPELQSDLRRLAEGA